MVGQMGLEKLGGGIVNINIPIAQECKYCTRSESNGGQCKGKRNISIPCLAFKDKEI